MELGLRVAEPENMLLLLLLPLMFASTTRQNGTKAVPVKTANIECPGP
jgi:hypothetical protein